MADQALDDPVAQARQLVAESRQAFARDVDAILADLSVDLTELRRAVLEKFDQYVPMQRLADTVLLQLVKEAFDHFENPESRVDIKDWVKVAKRFVEEPGRKRA
jgi:hypothetical protein